MAFRFCQQILLNSFLFTSPRSSDVCFHTRKSLNFSCWAKVAAPDRQRITVELVHHLHILQTFQLPFETCRGALDFDLHWLPRHIDLKRDGVLKRGVVLVDTEMDNSVACCNAKLAISWLKLTTTRYMY